MSKLIVMTDPHLVPASGQIIGLDPAARLSQGLLHAAERHADADRLIIMGDLTNTGDATSYEALREALSKMPWPVTLMMGNHDHRPTFRKVFPDHPTDPTGFVTRTCPNPDGCAPNGWIGLQLLCKVRTGPVSCSSTIRHS